MEDYKIRKPSFKEESILLEQEPTKALKAARYYFEKLNWKILPGSAGSKHPDLLPNYKDYKDGKIEITKELIEEWFSNPKCTNILLLTAQSDMAVIDVDINKETGEISPEAHELLKIIPETITSTTGSGGKHYFYKNKVDKKDKIGILPGVDLRKECIIVLPPSRHANQNTYTWDKGYAPWDKEEIHTFDPTWIEEKEAVKFISDQKKEKPYEELLTRGYLQAGTRNVEITSLYGLLSKRIQDRPDLTRFLIEAVNNASNSPLSQIELDNIAKKQLEYHPPVSTDLGIFDSLWLKDLMELDFPPIEWIIKGLIPREGTCLLSGNPGNYKTWLLLAIAVAISSGTPLFGKFETMQGTVWIIDKENKKSALKERISMLTQNKDLPIIISCTKHFNFKQELDLIREFIQKHNIKFVIYDSFRRFLTGDENNSTDVSRLFDSVTKLHELGLSNLFSHHHKKNNLQTMEFGNVHKLRGSTDILASVDSHLIVEKKQEHVSIEHNKSRYGEEIPAFKLKINTDNTTYFNFEYQGQEIKASKSEKTREVIKNLLTGAGWVKRQDLLPHIKNVGEVGDRLVDKELFVLIGDGVIERKLEGKEVFFRIKPELEQNE